MQSNYLKFSIKKRIEQYFENDDAMITYVQFGFHQKMNCNGVISYLPRIEISVGGASEIYDLTQFVKVQNYLNSHIV